MKLPRKTVVDRQADHIRDTFENVDDKSLAMLSGGGARYGLVPPPSVPDPTTEGSTTKTEPLPPITQPPTIGDLLSPPPPVKK
jgi:hypothetical protein